MRLRAHVSTVADLARVRELMPELRDTPPADLRGRILDRVLDLGDFGAIDGPQALVKARELGLRVEADRESTVRHVCFNRTRNCAVLPAIPQLANASQRRCSRRAFRSSWSKSIRRSRRQCHFIGSSLSSRWDAAPGAVPGGPR